MKVLKALLAVLTALAVALTAALLFIEVLYAPRYIQIYEIEQFPRIPKKDIPQPERHAAARAGGFVVFIAQNQHKNAADFLSAAFA